MKWFFRILKFTSIICLIVFFVKTITFINSFKQQLSMGFDLPENNQSTDLKEPGLPERLGTGQGKADVNKKAGPKNGKIQVPDKENQSNINDAQAEKPVTIKKEKVYFLTYDELVSMQSMGLLDKLKAMYIAGKLSSSERKEILRIADGGITEDEYEILGPFLEEALSAKDMKFVNKLINKARKDRLMQASR